MGAVDAVPVVIEIPADAHCSDRDRARARLEILLTASRAPRRGAAESGRWRLRMMVNPGDGHTLRAEAELSDDAGEIVATRSMSDRTSGRCEALAAAVGAWTQLALDEALADASEPSKVARGSAPPAPSPASPLRSEDSRTPADGRPSLDTAGLAIEDPDVRPTPAIEGGALAVLRSGGMRSSTMVGFSPFVTVALSDRWLVRPSLLFARSRTDSSSRNGIRTLEFGGRLDFCGRIPGNYVRRRGIEFDLCMGSDVIYHWSDVSSVTRASLGPAATIRGELGWDIGLEIRSMTGISLIQNSLPGEGGVPLLVTSVEFGASMRIR